MKVEEALLVMARIDGQADGTEARAALVAELYQKLMKDPENFWEEFFTQLDAATPNATRELAEQWLRDGVANESTTFAEADELLKKYYAPVEQKQ